MNFDREKFWTAYRTAFVKKGVLPPSVFRAIEDLLDRFENSPEWSAIPQISYAFATVKHETAHTFEPIEEYGPDSYFSKYDTRTDLGNTPQRDGDGLKFKGRGFVQITGKANYEKFSKLLGVDLIKNPVRTLEPEIAFQIMTFGMHRGLFTGHKLADHINSRKKDYEEARRIINRKDKAATIAGYARTFESILKSSLVSATAQPAVIPPEASTEGNTSLNQTPEQSPDGQAVETSKTFTDVSGGQKVEQSVETKNEQSVKDPAEVTEPKPQGLKAKLAAGLATLFGGTLIYDSMGKLSGIQFSMQTIYIICFLIFIAFLGFCVWAVLDAWKSNKRVEIEALANTDITRKNIVWVKPEQKPTLWQRITGKI